MRKTGEQEIRGKGLVNFYITKCPTFTLNNVIVDGLGRLKGANETITKADASTISHSHIFAYDMRSQLTDANISNINGGNWVAKYSYHDNGDMAYRIIQSDSQTFSYNGHLMTSADGNSLDYDENGQLTSGIGTSLVWNWDNKLRSAAKGNTAINLKYDAGGNRIAKDVNVSQTVTARKYIVDVVGDLPTVLLVLDNSQNVLNRYIYANSQIVAQHDVSDNNKLYFYLHDRLGSVREIIDTSGSVVKYYTYQPFGETIESGGTLINPFMFSGQFFDDEIGQYYLRARQYDPHISRFTSRDPVDGKFEEPLSLHKYLYCENEPINGIDPQGLWFEKVHRQFGKLGWGYDPKKGWAPFDYARLDFDKSPFDPKYTGLHYRSRREIFGELLGAATVGSNLEFEYLMHQWQDSYVHYDRDFHAPFGHAPFKEVDDPEDPPNKKRNSYDRCKLATLVWEEIWFKNNVTVWDDDFFSKRVVNVSTPWLSYSKEGLSWLIDY